MPPAVKEKPTTEYITPMPPPWSMPKPELPMVTWWHGDGSGRAETALVVGVYNDTVDVIVMSATTLPFPRTGCRHRTDPSLKTRTEANPGGIFEVLPLERKIHKLFDQLIGPED